MLINILQKIIWPKMSMVTKLRDPSVSREKVSHSLCTVGEGSPNTVNHRNFTSPQYISIIPLLPIQHILRLYSCQQTALPRVYDPHLSGKHLLLQVLVPILPMTLAAMTVKGEWRSCGTDIS